MSNAWLFQSPTHVKKHGEDNASWYLGWIDPDGKRRCKSCGPGSFGKIKAEKLKKQIEAELLTGTYQPKSKKTWDEFVAKYETDILDGQAPRTKLQALIALAHFQRIIKPVRVSSIKTTHISDFVTARRKEPGKKRGSLISPYSVNKDLRHLKAALNVAKEWEFINAVPKFRMEKTPEELPTYVTGDHFAVIYQGCRHAKMPRDQPYPASDWWQSLMVMGYMTGWRISDMLGLRRDDLDLDAGTAITRAADNKGKRSEKVKLHPVVIEHLKKIASFDVRVFPWNYNRRTLDSQFLRIQKEAGIHLPCHGEHEHTEYCYVYGFHDLRRAFATMNADKLTADALQTLMRHKSYQTTQLYINMARQMDEAVASLHVPDVLRMSR